MELLIIVLLALYVMSVVAPWKEEKVEIKYYESKHSGEENEDRSACEILCRELGEHGSDCCD